MGVNSYRRIKEGMIEMGVEEAQMAAVISTKVIDADRVSQMSPEEVGSAEYILLLRTIIGVKQDCGIKYMYTLYEDGERYIAESMRRIRRTKVISGSRLRCRMKN